MPSDSITASWVIAGSCMVADGLATALWFCEPERLAGVFAYQYLFVREYQIQSSRGFGARLYAGDLV